MALLAASVPLLPRSPHRLQRNCKWRQLRTTLLRLLGRRDPQRTAVKAWAQDAACAAPRVPSPHHVQLSDAAGAAPSTTSTTSTAASASTATTPSTSTATSTPADADADADADANAAAATDAEANAATATDASAAPSVLQLLIADPSRRRVLLAQMYIWAAVALSYYGLSFNRRACNPM